MEVTKGYVKKPFWSSVHRAAHDMQPEVVKTEAPVSDLNTSEELEPVYESPFWEFLALLVIELLFNH